jgi:putative transposase
MVDFIDRHREQYGVEPICAQLPIAPSQYYEHKARQADPERRPPRLRRDEALLPEIRRVQAIWSRSGIDGVAIAQRVKPA